MEKTKMISQEKDYDQVEINEDDMQTISGSVLNVEYRCSATFKLPVDTVLVEPGNQYSGRKVERPTMESVTVTRGMMLEVPEGMDVDKVKKYARENVVSDITWEYNNRIKFGRLSHYKEEN